MQSQMLRQMLDADHWPTSAAMYMSTLLESSRETRSAPEHVYRSQQSRMCSLALRDVDLPTEVQKPLFYNLAKHYDGQDHFYRAALNIACGTDPARRDAILADFDKHFPEWNDKVADLVWELRPKSVLPRLGKLLDRPEADRRAEGPHRRHPRRQRRPGGRQDACSTLLDGDAAARGEGPGHREPRLFLPTKWKGLARRRRARRRRSTDLLDDPKTTRRPGCSSSPRPDAADRARRRREARGRREGSARTFAARRSARSASCRSQRVDRARWHLLSARRGTARSVAASARSGN